MRLLIACFLLVLTLAAGYGAWESVKRPPQLGNGPVAIAVRPLVLDGSDPVRTSLGKLHFLGAWHLTGPNRSFGGLSALHIGSDGMIWALNDTGTMIVFPQPGAPGTAMVKRLPQGRQGRASAKERLPEDSESMAFDPATGRTWVGFELLQRICRYGPGLARVEKCRDWPEMKDWSITASLESMARLPDGRFLVIAEGAVGDRPGRDVLLFSGDPVAYDTPHPVRMSYVPPVGYDPTDALALGKDKLLVLNRRATIYDGFTAILTLVDIGSMKPGAVLTGREIARLAPPVLSDNFEGLALEQGSNGQRILWIVSDDNHLFFERTLLLKFALPDSF